MKNVREDGHLLGATPWWGTGIRALGLDLSLLLAQDGGSILTQQLEQGGTEEHSPLKELQGPQRACAGGPGHRNPHLEPNWAMSHWGSTSVHFGIALLSPALVLQFGVREGHWLEDRVERFW